MIKMIDVFILLFLLFILVSCRKNEVSTENMEQRTQQYIPAPAPAPAPPAPPKLTFDKVNEKGVLIGYDMELLDSTLNTIQEIDAYNEFMVDITAVSRTYHYPQFSSDTFAANTCQKFKYVKIKTKDFEGIVEGQNVYRLIESPLNKIISTLR